VAKVRTGERGVITYLRVGRLMPEQMLFRGYHVGEDFFVRLHDLGHGLILYLA
jgi:hypothetical protein